MGVSRTTVRALRLDGFDIVHLWEAGLEKLSDAEILAKATREQRIIVTFDLDFGDLMAATGQTLPSVIILRIHDETPFSVTPKLRSVLDMHSSELQGGAIVIVEDTRHRIRRLPIDGGE